MPRYQTFTTPLQETCKKKPQNLSEALDRLIAEVSDGTELGASLKNLEA